MNSTSLKKLLTCHDDIYRLAKEVDSHFPIQCICGHRGAIEQEQAFTKGMSKLHWPDSAHNKTPAEAGDFVPDPDENPATVEWNDIEMFEKMCAAFEEAAKKLKIKIRLGRDFHFKDFPHIELVT